MSGDGVDSAGNTGDDKTDGQKKTISEFLHPCSLTGMSGIRKVKKGQDILVRAVGAEKLDE